MNEPDEAFENELRALKPTPLSPQLQERILARMQPSRSKVVALKPRSGMGILDVAALVIATVLLSQVAVSLWPEKFAPAPAPAPAQLVSGGGDAPATPATPGLTEQEREAALALIKKLRSTDYDERQSAVAALSKLDARYLPLLEPLLKSADLEERALALKSVRPIRANLLLKKIEAIAPGALEAFSKEDIAEHQKCVVQWAIKAPRRAVAPLLVELAGQADPSTVLWGCWDALNFYAAENTFLADKGRFGSSDSDDIYECLMSMDKNLQFSQAARELCQQTRSPKRVFGSHGVVLERQLSLAGVGFCMNEKDETHVFTAPEGAAYWAKWWEAARSTPEWLNGDPNAPSKANIKFWLAGLAGQDALAQAKARLNLISNWKDPTVQAAVAALAGDDTPAGSHAKELQELCSLRNTGKILFLCGAWDNSTLWVMNPDGSEQEPLKVDGYATRHLFVSERCGDEFLLLDRNDRSCYWWKPGMKSPYRIDGPQIGNWCLRQNSRQVLYWKCTVENPGHGNPHLYDLNTKKELPLPKELQDSEYPNLSPDEQWVAYMKPSGDIKDSNDCWMYNFKTGIAKPLMKSNENVELSNMSTQWSANSIWIKCAGFKNVNGKREGVLRIANVQTGEIRDVKAHGYIAYPRFVWARQGDTAYLFLSKDVYSTLAISLFRWTPEAGLQPIEIPKAFQLGNTGFTLEILPDGLLQVHLYQYNDETWFIDPSGRRPARRGAPRPKDILTKIDKGWSMTSAAGAPGTISKQILLISPAGSRIPITNLPGGCSDPYFIPGPWPELK